MLNRQIAAVLLSLAVGCQGSRKAEDSKGREPYGVVATDKGGAGAASGSAVGGSSAGSAHYDVKQVVAADPLATSGNGFKDYGTNAWLDTAKDRLSTFAADVDTASYTIARRMLSEGSLP